MGPDWTFRRQGYRPAPAQAFAYYGTGTGSEFTAAPGTRQLHAFVRASQAAVFRTTHPPTRRQIINSVPSFGDPPYLLSVGNPSDRQAKSCKQGGGGVTRCGRPEMIESPAADHDADGLCEKKARRK